MRELKDILLTLLVTLFGTVFIVLAIVFLVVVFECITDGTDFAAIAYVFPFAAVSFALAFVSYRIYRKFRNS